MFLGYGPVASDNEAHTHHDSAGGGGTREQGTAWRYPGPKVTGNTCNLIFVAVSYQTFRKPAFTQRICQCLRSACSLPHCSRSLFAARRLHRRRVFPTPSAAISRPSSRIT